LSGLIKQCWDEDPDVRPVFVEIIVRLEDILQQVQVELELSKPSFVQTTGLDSGIVFCSRPREAVDVLKRNCKINLSGTRENYEINHRDGGKK
jgi:hypothetical protein